MRCHAPRNAPIVQAKADTVRPRNPAPRIDERRGRGSKAPTPAPALGAAAFSFVDVPIHSPGGGAHLPGALRAGVEQWSGVAMDDVRVHRNSPEPAKLGALAYTRGSDIHLGPNQEEHLPHEAWHAAQQKQGRVRATTQLKGVAINDSSALEAEADLMRGDESPRAEVDPPAIHSSPLANVVQRTVKRGTTETLLDKSEPMSEVLREYVKSEEKEYILGKNSEDDLMKLPVHLFDTSMKFLLGEEHDYEGREAGTAKWNLETNQWPTIPKIHEDTKTIPQERDDQTGLLYQEPDPKPLENQHAYLLLELLSAHDNMIYLRERLPKTTLDDDDVFMVSLYSGEIEESLGEVEKTLSEYDAFAAAYDPDLHATSARLTNIYNFSSELSTSWIVSLSSMMGAARLFNKFLAKISAAIEKKEKRTDEQMEDDANTAKSYVKEIDKFRNEPKKLAKQLAGIVDFDKPDQEAAVRAFAESDKDSNQPTIVSEAVNAARERGMIANVNRLDPPLLVGIGNYHVYRVAGSAKQPAQAVDMNDTLETFTGKTTFPDKK